MYPGDEASLPAPGCLAALDASLPWMPRIGGLSRAAALRSGLSNLHAWRLSGSMIELANLKAGQKMTYDSRPLLGEWLCEFVAGLGRARRITKLFQNESSALFWEVHFFQRCISNHRYSSHQCVADDKLEFVVTPIHDRQRCDLLLPSPCRCLLLLLSPCHCGSSCPFRRLCRKACDRPV